MLDSKCKLCTKENKRILVHYISEYHVIYLFRLGSIISPDALEDIIMSHPIMEHTPVVATFVHHWASCITRENHIALYPKFVRYYKDTML